MVDWSIRYGLTLIWIVCTIKVIVVVVSGLVNPIMSNYIGPGFSKYPV